MKYNTLQHIAQCEQMKETKLAITPQIERELPVLIEYIAQQNNRAASIPFRVASVSTILYAQQEGWIVRGEHYFSIA